MFCVVPHRLSWMILQSAMLFAEAEAFPDLWTTTPMESHDVYLFVGGVPFFLAFDCGRLGSNGSS